MKNLFYLLLVLFICQNSIMGQVKRDPRAIGMANAYTTIADGFFAVGYNPAMIFINVDLPAPFSPKIV